MKRFWLILVSLALIGGLGYFGWKAYSENRAQTNNTQNNTNQTNDPSEGGRYLVIKEWGVRFPVSEKFRNTITYKIGGSNPPEGSAVFATNLLAGTSCDIVPNPDNPNYWLSNGIYLVRSKEKYVKESYKGSEVVYYDLGRIGSYWYSNNKKGVSCSNDEATENEFTNTLLKGFEGLEGI